MIPIVQIDDKLISSDVWRERFMCDITQCGGICCVNGDSGAPLVTEEENILRTEYPNFVEYMQPDGIRIVERQGFAVIDSDGDMVTPLINGRECVYSYFDDDGICFCAIERACREGRTTFRKPISCWLYPIRLKQFTKNTGLNYDKQDICNCAKKKGKMENIPVFRFLREPLIHHFGISFYEEMEKVFETIN